MSGFEQIIAELIDDTGKRDRNTLIEVANSSVEKFFNKYNYYHQSIRDDARKKITNAVKEGVESFLEDSFKECKDRAKELFEMACKASSGSDDSYEAVEESTYGDVIDTELDAAKEDASFDLTNINGLLNKIIGMIISKEQCMHISIGAKKEFTRHAFALYFDLNGVLQLKALRNDGRNITLAITSQGKNRLLVGSTNKGHEVDEMFRERQAQNYEDYSLLEGDTVSLSVEDIITYRRLVRVSISVAH